MKRVWIPVVAVAALGALVVVARWEGRRQTDEQLRGLAQVRAAVGPLSSPALTAYRLSRPNTCLAYRRGAHPYALELCFDAAGRLVEASDRRGSVPKVFSLRFDPDAADVVLPQAETDPALGRLKKIAMVNIWSGVVSQVEVCVNSAHILSSLPVGPARAKMAEIAAVCAVAHRSVGDSAHLARDAGLSALEAAAEDLDTVLRDYGTAFEMLQPALDDSPSAALAALRRFERTEIALNDRMQEIVRHLHRAVPSLAASPRLEP